MTDTRTARLVLGLVAVAIGAAAFAIAFRASLAAAYVHLYGAKNVLDAMRGLPPWLTVVVPGIGGLAAGAVVTRWSPRGQNVSNVMEAIALGRVHLSMRATASRTVASGAAICAGMSIGREGPLIEFGGALGNTVARVLRLPNHHLRVLVAAGTAAGFGAAYNTPFAAVLFVLETMVGIVALEALLPVMAATVIAVTLTRAVVGGGPIYGQRLFTLSSPSALIWFGLLGVLAAGMAWSFKRVLALGEALVERYPVPLPWRTALGGLLVGIIALAVPHVAGNGAEALNVILDQGFPVRFLLVLLVVKILATAASVSSGVPGGVFTPVMLVGGALGALWGHGLLWAGLAGGNDVGGYALVGMAAMTAATTHAPLTAAVMIFELSGDYPIVLPLLLATMAGTTISRLIGSDSIYADELGRRGIAWELTLDGRRSKSDIRD